jgi:hypothetical protein
MHRALHLTLTCAGVGLVALLLALAVGDQPPLRANDDPIKVPDDYPTIQAAIDAEAAMP